MKKKSLFSFSQILVSLRILFIVIIIQISSASYFNDREDTVIKDHQVQLSAVIEETIKQSNFINYDKKLYYNYFRKIYKYDENFKSITSSINKICEPYNKNNNNNLTNDIIKRTGCCSPSDVRHIYNAMIQEGKLILFKRPNNNYNSSNNNNNYNDNNNLILPPVTSVKKMEKDNFNIPINEKYLSFNEKIPCKYYFNGTLHIIGKSTIHNVYHAGKKQQ